MVGAVSYALMNLVMTSSPLAVVGCGYQTSDAANIVGAHVLAMFVPSLFTGHLIARFGVEKIMGTGLVILACAGAVAIAGVELENFYAALILLGLGWNFGFIGATTLLDLGPWPRRARTDAGAERHAGLRRRDGGLDVLGRADELFGRLGHRRLAGGQPRHGPLPHPRRRIADLAGPAETRRMKLDIFSDPVCPWCYLGKANLDRALEVDADHPFEVEWHPFQLNPEMPAGGVDKREYLSARFGAGQLDAIHQRFRDIAAKAG